jgi:hypothetical protein
MGTKELLGLPDGRVNVRRLVHSQIATARPRRQTARQCIRLGTWQTLIAARIVR